MKLKSIILAAAVAALFVGCVSEQERLAREAAEKARQEQLEREAKEREEREAKERLAREAAEKARQEQLAREAKEREEREAKELARQKQEIYKKGIEEYYTNLAEHNYKLAVILAQDRDAYLNDWLQPRSGISADNAREGEALMSEFGEKYLPNKYRQYEAARECAQEIQQLYKESFPSGKGVSPSEIPSLLIVLKKFSKARTKYFRMRDELCHFYIMHKAGALSEGELAAVDSENRPFWLLENLSEGLGMDLGKAMPLTSVQEEFADKYATGMLSIYRDCQIELQEIEKVISGLQETAQKLDVIRCELAIVGAVEKKARLVSMLSDVVTTLQGWVMQHKIMEKSAEEIAKLDDQKAKEVRKAFNGIKDYVKTRANGPLIPDGRVEDWHWSAIGFPTNKRERWGYGENTVYDTSKKRQMDACLSVEHYFPEGVRLLLEGKRDDEFRREWQLREDADVGAMVIEKEIRWGGLGINPAWSRDGKWPKHIFAIGSICPLVKVDERGSVFGKQRTRKLDTKTDGAAFIRRLNEIDGDKGEYKFVADDYKNAFSNGVMFIRSGMPMSQKDADAASTLGH